MEKHVLHLSNTLLAKPTKKNLKYGAIDFADTCKRMGA